MDGLTCPKCGAPRDPLARECPACGVIYAKAQTRPPALTPVITPAATNPYAPPQTVQEPAAAPPPPSLPEAAAVEPLRLASDAPAAGPAPPPEVEGDFWRLGPLLVLRCGGQLPERCVRCNRPATVRWLRTFAWLAGAPSIAGRRNLIANLMIFSRSREQAAVAIPLCHEHEQEWRQTLRQGKITTFVGAGLLALAQAPFVGYGHHVLLTVLGLSITLASLYFVNLEGSPLEARKITGTYAWLSGADPAFLDTLPLAPPLPGTPDDF